MDIHLDLPGTNIKDISMKTLLIIAWLCNLIDTIATVYLTNLGYIEANLLMSCLLAHPVIFVLVKMILMTGLLLFLWLRRTDKHAKPMATVATVVYGAIAVYYAWFFHAIL